ncbi:hypothetical protein HELRODRAFT_170050 [Helobdella robusta]|uniref:Uncharacterized protein n=1 Tax=Helobdella robusta TaxID=6412 RepID=T1F2L1_HELRO|nr:hypothetical protein HELRODRAFT_170050 [Helobdella robusta]ESO07512.1 hypothetical protein HELRODRAFT_170050 [Helobdella robusta]
MFSLCLCMNGFKKELDGNNIKRKQNNNNRNCKKKSSKKCVMDDNLFDVLPLNSKSADEGIMLASASTSPPTILPTNPSTPPSTLVTPPPTSSSPSTSAPKNKSFLKNSNKVFYVSNVTEGMATDVIGCPGPIDVAMVLSSFQKGSRCQSFYARHFCDFHAAAMIPVRRSFKITHKHYSPVMFHDPVAPTRNVSTKTFLMLLAQMR